jgi:hypothetical protein
MQSWHFSRLKLRTQTLVKIGENAAALVDAYPATAPERTTLRQHLCQSMLSCLLLIAQPLDIKPCGVKEVFGISSKQACRTQLRDNNARSMFSPPPCSWLDLRLPPIHRNKMGDKRKLLKDFFKTIQPRSGLIVRF